MGQADVLADGLIRQIRRWIQEAVDAIYIPTATGSSGPRADAQLAGGWDAANYPSSMVWGGYIGADVGTIYVGGEVVADQHPQVWKSTDAGRTWAHVAEVTTACRLNLMIGTDQGSLIAGMNNGHIYRSTDQGATWSDIGQLGTCTDVGFIADGTGGYLVAVATYVSGGTHYKYYYSEDDGASWVAATTQPTDTLRVWSLHCYDTAGYFMVGVTGGIWISTDGSGDVWASAWSEAGATTFWFANCANEVNGPTETDTIVALYRKSGAEYYSLWTADGGSTWNASPSPICKRGTEQFLPYTQSFQESVLFYVRTKNVLICLGYYATDGNEYYVALATSGNKGQTWQLEQEIMHLRYVNCACAVGQSYPVMPVFIAEETFATNALRECFRVYPT